jgi:hypothetical protein
MMVAFLIASCLLLGGVVGAGIALSILHVLQQRKLSLPVPLSDWQGAHCDAPVALATSPLQGVPPVIAPEQHCPSCGASPGEWCRTGYPYMVHDARTNS